MVQVRTPLVWANEILEEVFRGSCERISFGKRDGWDRRSSIASGFSTNYADERAGVEAAIVQP